MLPHALILIVAMLASPVIAADAPPVASAPGVACPACAGVGTIACRSCKDGKRPCPKPCLKKTDPGWKKMKVAGHPDDELWREFHSKDGKVGRSWTQHHVGDLIEVTDHDVVNLGTCPTCSGTGSVTCAVCKGAGKTDCSLCKGTGTVDQAAADAWAAKRKAAQAADRIALADGRSIDGRIVSRTKTEVIIKQADGTLVTVKPEELKDQP